MQGFETHLFFAIFGKRGEAFMFETALDIIKLIVGSVVIIAAAYYTTWFIANRRIKKVRGRSIQVNERFSITKDKMICTVEVNGKVYLLALTNGGATVIDTFDADDFAQEEAPASAAAPGTAEDDVNPFQDSGFMQRTIWSAFNALRKRGSKKKPASSSFEDTMKSASAEEIIGRYADNSGEEELDGQLSFAREEDSIDEIQRRLQSRRAKNDQSAHDAEGESDE